MNDPLKSILVVLIGVVAVASAHVPTVAHASSRAGVTVTEVDVRAGGRFVVSFSGTLNNPASCVDTSAERNLSRMSSTDDSFLRLALAAFLSGQQVDVWGTNSCNEWSTVESMSRLLVRN